MKIIFFDKNPYGFFWQKRAAENPKNDSRHMPNTTYHGPKGINTIKTTVGVRALDKLNSVKLGYSGSVLGLSQFLLLHQLPLKMMLVLKGVKSDLKIINSLHQC